MVDSGSFSDDVVLLVSSGSDFLLALRQFAADYEVGWMRISPTKSEAMVLTGVCTLDQGQVAAPGGGS